MSNLTRFCITCTIFLITNSLPSPNSHAFANFPRVREESTKIEKKAMNSEKEMVHKIEVEGDRARCILDQARQKFYEIEDILLEVEHILKQAKKHRDRAEDTLSDCKKINLRFTIARK